MCKRITILVLLLMSVFFYSCSSNKNTTEIKQKDVVIPVHSNHMNEDLQKSNEKKEETYEDKKKKHYKSQTKATRKSMKKNEKISRKNTPVRKKKSSLFCRKKGCLNNVDKNMLNDGVSDTRQ